MISKKKIHLKDYVQIWLRNYTNLWTQWWKCHKNRKTSDSRRWFFKGGFCEILRAISIKGMTFLFTLNINIRYDIMHNHIQPNQKTKQCKKILINKIRNKQKHHLTVGTIPKSNINIVERGKIDTSKWLSHANIFSLINVGRFGYRLTNVPWL